MTNVSNLEEENEVLTEESVGADLFRGEYHTSIGDRRLIKRQSAAKRVSFQLAGGVLVATATKRPSHAAVS